MKIAIVGCGYVCDYYLTMFKNHPEIQVTGVMDIIDARAAKLSKNYSVPMYPNIEEVLNDKQVTIVVNLTSPKSHYEVSKKCLEAGKHVYTEKPLALNFSQANELVAFAESKKLQIVSAPCTVLGEAAQSVWKALREKKIGTVRLVYAEMDDGLIHRMRYRKWKSASGNLWPYKDEFETGCTLEHAGYLLTWLVAFFGPAESVTSFASCLIQDKETDVPLDFNAPDFSVACIRFHSGVVARLTCSIIAPHNHSLKIFGDEGELFVKDSWLFSSAIYLRRNSFIGRFLRGKYPLVRKKRFKYKYKGPHEIDYCRGISELAKAIKEDRLCRLSPMFSLHIIELALAIHNSQKSGGVMMLQTTCELQEPMEWAK